MGNINQNYNLNESVKIVNVFHICKLFFIGREYPFIMKYCPSNFSFSSTHLVTSSKSCDSYSSNQQPHSKKELLSLFVFLNFTLKTSKKQEKPTYYLISRFLLHLDIFQFLFQNYFF